MKHALVLGASGGMGYSIVHELVNRGIKVTAFARSEEKLKDLYHGLDLVTIQSGDVFDMNQLVTAASQADTIFQAANLPYEQWSEKLIPFYKNVIQSAEVTGAKLAFVENIYAYGKSPSEKVTETMQKNPHTKKGKIRLQVEELIKRANVEAIIAHFPDFYGPNAENSILHFTLKNVIQHKNAFFVGDQHIAREFIYTPDGAKALVTLALEKTAYGQNWNIPGYDVMTGDQLIAILRSLLGYKKSVFTVTKGMIRMLGLFNPTMREVVEMFYLNEEPVILNGAKYEKEIGPLPRTSYQEGLKQTVHYMATGTFQKAQL